GDELHARDYLVYAYLQRGQDAEARKALEEAPRDKAGDPSYFSGLYSIATMPARFAVERHAWAEAAALTLPRDMFPGGRYAWTESNLYFSKELGAARMCDTGREHRAVHHITITPEPCHRRWYGMSTR